MNGDGMGGLAVAILLAMVFMLVVPVVVLVLIAKRFGTGAVIGAVIVGLLIGVLAVTATFMESTWSPPPAINLIGTSEQTYIVVVADEKAPPVVMTGSTLPFMQRKTTLQVPDDGVIRVQSLEPLQGDMSMEVTYRGKKTVGLASMRDGMVFDFSPSPEPVDYEELIKTRLAK